MRRVLLFAVVGYVILLICFTAWHALRDFLPDSFTSTMMLDDMPEPPKWLAPWKW